MRRLALVLVLAGCSKLVGISDVTLPPDGNPGGNDGQPDAPSNTVVGRSFFRCTTAAGVAEAPIDQTAQIIQALVPDPADPSGYRVSNGTGMADGTFTIPNVPDGEEYVLKFGRTYFVTTQHVIDRHFEQPIRCDPAPTPITGTTTINFAVANMQPFSNAPNGVNDGIEVASFNAGYLAFAQGTPNNAVSFNTTLDYGAQGFFTNPPGLVDAAQGDDLSLFHLRTETVTGNTGRKHALTRLVDTFLSTTVTLQDATANTVTGTWTPAAPNKTLAASMTRGAFDVGYDGTSEFSGASVTVRANPVLNDFGFGATLASFDLSDWSRSASLTESFNFMYSDPLPASWVRMLDVSYSRFRFILFPGTTIPRPSSFFPAYSRQLALAGNTPSLTPTLAPPGGAKVGGVELGLGGKVAFDGAAPITVTWNAVNGAKLYQIVVVRVFANGNQTRTQVVGTLFTTKTSLAVPAEVFAGGEFFAFDVSARQGPYDYNAGEIIPNGAPLQSAGVSSGLFRLSAKCGNGTVDLGEDCDTMGETASCDVDCTARSCGDGLRNAAAGEACDTIVETPGCDFDCTLPACGDGVVNVQVEDCDDGNTIDDANGCSAQCKLNNFCGNSAVQLGEECDQGGDVATCDSDCTIPECGDGHHNALAGEACDDGNFETGDGCEDCQIVN